MKPALTIGMACFDDFDGVYYTVQALRFYHADAMERCEIVVVDNNPDSAQGKATRDFIQGAARSVARYVPYTDRKGSCPPRGHLFAVANGEFVACVDCHVFLLPGSVSRLLDYCDAHPDSGDLLHGVLMSNSGGNRIEATHMVPKWRSEMYGTWGVDDRGKNVAGEPFEIPQHGLGFFACRKDAWLGFNPEFNGFSGGEGYIQEKFRQAGKRVLCHPGVRWLHKFTRPLGCPHRPRLGDKIRNHLIGWHELDMDLQPIVDHFVGGVGTRNGKQKMSATRMQELIDQCGIDFSVSVPEKPTAKTGVVVGPSSFGSFQMRGRPLADHIRWPVHNSRGRVKLPERFDIGLAVKADAPPVMRQQCDRLIYDVLDAWFACSRAMRMAPEQYWKARHDKLRFDDILATSPAAAESMRKALPNWVQVHLVPHHADPRVQPDWHDPDGPIVYAGGRMFVDRLKPVIDEAVKKIGRQIVWDHQHHAWKSLERASLALCLRLPPSDVELNRIAKPQVKVANAAQAGIPVLTTDDPCTLSLWPDVVHGRVSDFQHVDRVAELLKRALESEPPKVRFPQAEWLKSMAEVIG